MVWVNFGERRRGIWWTGCRAMFLSSSLKYVLNYLKILAMENVKIQGLSGLSRDLRPSSVIFSSRNFSSFNWVKLFTKSLHETCNQFFFRSHYGHLIVLEGLTEMIVTFSFWWSVTSYIPNRPSIFLKSEIKMLKKY